MICSGDVLRTAFSHRDVPYTIDIARHVSTAGKPSYQQLFAAMVSTLVPCFVVAAVLVGAFFVLRAKQKRLYAPRTYHDALFEEYVLQ